MFVANIAPILIVSEACGLSPQDKGRLIQVAMIVVGAADFGSWKNWLLGAVTLTCCLLFNIFAKRYLKQLSVLF